MQQFWHVLVTLLVWFGGIYAFQGMIYIGIMMGMPDACLGNLEGLTEDNIQATIRFFDEFLRAQFSRPLRGVKLNYN